MNGSICRILREAGWILSVAVGVAVVGNAVSPKGIALVGSWDTRNGVITAEAKDDRIRDGLEIPEPAVAKAVYDHGGTVFLDARSESDFQAGHIEGAISFPVATFETRIVAFWDTVPMTTDIVTYCSGRLCTDSHHLAQLLLDSGYTKVRVFIDGNDAWEKAGYPVGVGDGEKTGGT